MVGAMRRRAEDGSAAEQRFTCHVFGEAEAALTAPIQDLAIRVGVSNRTAPRSCRARACDGMRDVKLRLAQIFAFGGDAMFPEPVKRSELVLVADIMLGLFISSDRQVVKPSPGRYAAPAVIDLLASSVAETIGPGTLEGLRRIRQSLTALDISVTGRPIAD